MLFRTTVYVAALASLSLTAGCTGIPAVYAYPKIAHFPATDLNAGGAEVQAFLVKTTCPWRQPLPGPENLPRHEVTRLPVSTDSHTVSHTSVSVEAFAGTLGPLCYGSGLEHESKIVLYRPGYDLVVIQSWERRKTIDWKPAVSIAAQERAVDDLVSAAPFSPAQRRENSFVADEYERLAGMSEDGDQLRAKAASFRSRTANEPPKLLVTTPGKQREQSPTEGLVNQWWKSESDLTDTATGMRLAFSQSGSARIAISPADSAYPGIKWIEQTVTVRNATDHTVFVYGTSLEHGIIVDVATRDPLKGEWDPLGLGYCGTGMKLQPLGAGLSFPVTISLPIELADREFRIEVKVYSGGGKPVDYGLDGSKPVKVVSHPMRMEKPDGG